MRTTYGMFNESNFFQMQVEEYIAQTNSRKDLVKIVQNLAYQEPPNQGLKKDFF